ncbi:tetratricopeptide repeat protein [Actinocorallia sp. API 0066]|uniref:tetratricopeptide repeat protein n=1 Tax=Actinocorallia sp. API 0066 TaxID=2896846 RepID=UPI001E382B93|nr:tetratricopeptide repeat protein [Actinocorallia sp. API 0066]MCD0447766.1 tetratricopeptide repeat protein [Actinocorallia sp. API 0066]
MLEIAAILVARAAERALGGVGEGVARWLTPKEHERLLRRALGDLRERLGDDAAELMDAVREHLGGRGAPPQWYRRFVTLEEPLAAALADLPDAVFGRRRRRVTGRELLARCGLSLQELQEGLTEALDWAVREEAALQGGLPELSRQREAAVGAKAARERPNTLPAGNPGFVNRGGVLGALSATANTPRAPGTPARAALTGAGGMGKTSTGVQWGHGVAELFPDGLVYVDFGDLGEREVLGPSDALTRILYALGAASEALPADYGARLQIFRRLTADRRYLFVYDNVRVARQVEDLFPAAAESMVLVMSRKAVHLPGPALRPLELKPLGHEYAERMLRDAVPHATGGQLARLAEQCGGWPLALRVVGGWAADGRPVEHVIARLRADPLGATEGEVRTVYSVTEAAYEDLPEDLRRAYRLLSLHPGERPPRFTRAAAAALLGGDPVPALSGLVERHLLEYAEGRYFFHGLVRTHAQEKAGDDPEAVLRLVEYYLAGAVQADTTVNPARARDAFGPGYRAAVARGTKGEALAWLDAEHRNLSAAVYEAVARGWVEPAWQLCEALWSLYFSLKYYDDWIATHREVLPLTSGLPHAAFRVGIQLGRGLAESGRHDEARPVLQGALDAAHHLGKPEHRATAEEFLARDRELAGDLTTALAGFQRALRLELEAGRARGVAIDHHHIGRVCLGLGDLNGASTALTAALEAFERLGDAYNRARVLHTFARVRRASGLDPSALLLDALAIMRAEGRAYQEAKILDDLAEATGEDSYREMARAIYERIGVI